jgi:hypothetical protein
MRSQRAPAMFLFIFAGLLLFLSAIAMSQQPAAPKVVPSLSPKVKSVGKARQEAASQELLQYPAPDLTWQTSESALVILRENNLLGTPNKRDAQPGDVVVAQSPAARTLVKAGTRVTFTLGQPQLFLDADGQKSDGNQDIKVTPVANQPVNFTLRFVPPLPKPEQYLMYSRLPVAYRFVWDASPASSQSPDLSHAFAQPGVYTTHGEADVLGHTYYSARKVFAFVQFTTVRLSAQSTRIRSGTPDTFTLDVEPPPRADTQLQYCFQWNDGTQESCGAANQATHSYSPRHGEKSYSPVGYVTIGGEFPQRSNTQDIALVSPIPNPPKPVPSDKYTVKLRGPEHLDVDQVGTFTAEVKPHVAKGQYCFDWPDAEPTCQFAPSAVHAFKSSGNYSVKAELTVNGEKFESDLWQTQVPLSWMGILWRAAIVLAGFGGAVTIYKLLAVTVGPHAGLPRVTMARSSFVHTGPLVRIRCVVPPPRIKKHGKAGYA